MSSYSEHNYGLVLEYLCKVNQPQTIIEFGILDGYSLERFVNFSPSNTKIIACDIFEDFIGNHASFTQISKDYSKYANLSIKKLDFYHSLTFISQFNPSTTLIHVDIANDGDVYEFAICFPIIP